LSRHPFRVRSASPERGEQTDDVLRGLGYDDAAIDTLRKSGII
jgi:crotonobetainyl-CoA:carnitine CoA-transferase CaiB-like acyl-CoA transferase